MSTPSAASTAPLGAEEAARTFQTLAGGLAELFTTVGSWVVTASPAGAAAFAAVSRRMGEQSVAWQALVPESILLGPARAAAEPPLAVWGPGGRPGGAEGECITVLAQVVGDLDALAAVLEARLSPVADGAARRQARVLRLDLDRAAELLAAIEPLRAGADGDGSGGPVTTGG